MPRKKTRPAKPAPSRKAIRNAQSDQLRRRITQLTQALKTAGKPKTRAVDVSLTPSQETFCLEWLKDHNASRAYLAAYPTVTKGSAGTEASRMLQNPKVALRLSNLMHAQLMELDFDAAEVLRYIRDGCRFDIRRLFDADGRPKQMHELTYEEAGQIEGYEIILKNAEAGDGMIDRVLKVKLTPRRAYHELAAIHFQLLVQQIRVSGQLTIVDETGTDEELLAQIDRILETAKQRAMLGGGPARLTAAIEGTKVTESRQ